MSYKTNQFWKLRESEDAIRRGSAEVRSNQQFGYPSNKVRTYYRKGKELVFDNVSLSKGYIRSLQNVYQTGPTEKTTTPTVRCDFQFNPTTLQQSVQMRTDVLNVFNQDPVQLTQPLASQTQFGFQLLFDRSFTYNNETNNRVLENIGSYDAPNIGVLHDLRVLYSIIGQGISEETIQFAIQSARNTVAAGDSQNNTGEEGTPTDGSTAPSDISVSSIPGNFDELANTYFSANLGNSGFLIPLPVRVVFSSLYMLDGYITSSSVIFTKFSTSYVPIQCMVTLNMQAMYIGFAKERTFLTDNLEKSKEQIDLSIETNKKAVEDARTLLVDYSPAIDTRVVTRDAPKSANDNKNYNNKIASLLTNEVEQTKRYIQLRIPRSGPTTLRSLFESNPTAVRITFVAFVEVYQIDRTDIKDDFLEKSRNRQSLPQGVTHSSTLNCSHTVSTLEEWDAIEGSSKEILASYSPHNPVSPEVLENQFGAVSKDYVLLFRISMTVTVGSGAESYVYTFNQNEIGGPTDTSLGNVIRVRGSLPEGGG